MSSAPGPPRTAALTREVELELPTVSILEAKIFVLSFGHFATAIAPDELILEIERGVCAMAESYASSEDDAQQ